MADNLTTATIDVRANTRGMERDILKALQTVELSQINTKKSSQALGRITGQVSEFNKSLEASNARVVAFGASAGAIFAVEKALSSLISSTINVQKQLADVNVLLNLSSSSLEKFGGSLFDIARNTAQSFSEVAAAATELSRQGLGVEETLKRTNAALILTRLSGLDAKSSVEALTATLNSFSGSALDAVEVVNKLANVDAAFAVSSADLANAISRVGSTAVDAGVSLDELIALVTSAQQTTARGGAVIGNSFKTIFTRLQRGKVQDLLGSLGVNTSEGQSAVSLLQQLASTYDTLGAAQKSAVAEQVGGVFQINILKAALADLGKEYSIYGQALQTSLGSTDQAIRRNELLNKTVSALSAQTVASLEEAANKIGTIVFEPNAKGFLSGFNNLLESFNNIDSESAGGKLMEGFFKGVSNFISGPGAVLATAVLVKLFARLGQFAAGSAKELLGTNKAAQQQAAIEQSILSILQKNSQFTSQILAGKMTTVQAEKQMLDYLTAQSNILREQERLSKVIGANLAMKGVSVGASGIPMTAPVKKTKVAASGYIPSFATDMAVGQAMENAGAREHGYRAGKAKKTTIHDGNGKSFKSFVNNKEDVKTFTNAAGKKATIVRPPNGFGENTQYAANGFIPNFAEKRIASVFKSGSSLRGLYDTGPVFDMYDDSAILKYQSLPKKYEEYRQEGRSIFEEARGVYNNSGQNINEANKYLMKRIPGGFGKKLNKDYFDKPFSENAINPIVGALGERDFFYNNPDFSKLEDYVGPDFKKGDIFAEVKILQKKISEKKLLEKALRGAAYSSAKKTFKNNGRDVVSPNLIFASAIKESMSSGFVPNFASMGSKFKAMYGGGTTMRATDKEKTAKKKNLDVKKLDLSDRYTMVHGGNQGLSSADVSLEAGNKLFDAKIATAGLNTAGTNLQRYGIKGVVGDALVSATNNIIKTFGGTEQITDASSLDNAGSVGSAAGTVFETALRKAFNAPAISQTQRIDFPAPTPELKKFFHNAPGQYEAKISRTPDNLKSALKKWVDVNGLASSSSSGFVPNFAKTSGISYSYKDKDEFGFSEIQAIMGGKKVGSFSYAEDKKGQIDVGDFSVNKGERGKGIGSGLYKEAIRRNAGKKMKGQLLPQMNRLLQKIKNGEPVSAETLYPQIKRADLAKSSVFEVYGHKGMTVEKMTRDQFSSFVNAKINELKKDPKKLQSFFGNVEADEYGGLGVDLQTQHSAGFIPNFSSALNDAIAREQSSGLSKSQIYVDSHSSLKNKNNPMGLMVANRRDEPGGGIQGIKRAKKEGRNPKTYGGGMSSGFVPNFAFLGRSEAEASEINSLQGELKKIDSEIANRKAEIKSRQKELATLRNDLKMGAGNAEAVKQTKALENENKGYEQAKLKNPQLSAGMDSKIAENNKKIIDIRNQQAEAIKKEIKSILDINKQNRELLTEKIKESEVTNQNLSTKKKETGFGGKAKNFLSNNALSIGFAAQAAGDIGAQFAGQESGLAKGISAATSGLGTIASFASLGSIIPVYGTAIGAAVGATVAFTQGMKAYNSKLPELSKAAEAASSEFNRFGETGQAILNLSERYAELANSTDPSAAPQLIKVQDEYSKLLLKLSDSQRAALVSAVAQGKGQEEYTKILKDLGTVQKAKNDAFALGQFAEGKTDKKSIQGIGKDLAAQIASGSGLNKEDLSNIGRYIDVSVSSGATSNRTMITAIEDAMRQGSISTEGKQSLQEIIPQIKALAYNEGFAGEAKDFKETLAKLIDDIKSGRLDEQIKSLQENQKRAAAAERARKDLLDKNNQILLNLSSGLEDASNRTQVAIDSFIDSLKFKAEFEQKRGDFRSSFFDQAGAGRAGKSEKLAAEITAIKNQGQIERTNILAESGKNIAEEFSSVIQALQLNDSGLAGDALAQAEQDFKSKKLQLQGNVQAAQTDFYKSGDIAKFQDALSSITAEFKKGGVQESNITLTEIDKLDNTSKSGFSKLDQNLQKGNRDQEKQLALLAQSNAYQEALVKLTEAQNFLGGASSQDVLTGNVDVVNTIRETQSAMNIAGQSSKNNSNVSKSKNGEYFFQTSPGKWEKPNADISNQIIQNAKATNEAFGAPIMALDNKKVSAATQTLADEYQKIMNEKMAEFGYEEDVKNKTFKPSFGQKKNVEAERAISQFNSIIPEKDRGKVRASEVYAKSRVNKELGVPETLKGNIVEKQLESYANAAFAPKKGASGQEKQNLAEMKAAYEKMAPDKGLGILQLTQSTKQTDLLSTINESILGQSDSLTTSIGASISSSIGAAIEKFKNEEENLKIGQLLDTEESLAGQSSNIDAKIEKLKQQGADSSPENFFPGGKYSNPAAVAAIDEAVGTGQDLNKIYAETSNATRDEYIDKNLKASGYMVSQSEYKNKYGKTGSFDERQREYVGNEYDRKKLIANELARREKAQKGSENIQNEIKRLESERGVIEGEKQKITKQITPEQRTKFEKSVDGKNKSGIPLATQPAATLIQPIVDATQPTPATTTPASRAISQASDSANKAKILQKFKNDEINSFMDQYTKFDKEGNVTFDPRTGFESQDQQDEFNKKYMALKKLQTTYTLADDSTTAPNAASDNLNSNTKQTLPASSAIPPSAPTPTQNDNKNGKPQPAPQQNTPENTAQLISNILQVVQKIATDFEQKAAGAQPGAISGTGSGNAPVSVSAPVNLSINSTAGENKTEVTNVADKIKTDLTAFLSSAEFIERVTTIAKQATGDKQPPKQMV
jgi:TP901 family phage tail tape measure protein